jgi:hypothetical protein
MYGSRVPVPVGAWGLQRTTARGSTVTITNLKELFEMLNQDYNNEWDYASDVIGCATLLAARRKCEEDLKILFNKDTVNHARIAEALAMQAHIEGLLSMFPDEVIAEATHVVEFILKRWQVS